MIKTLTLCALVALSTLTTLQAAPIFPTNSTWKYMKGTAEASTPDTAWRALGYDDSTWASGGAAFYYDTDTNPGTAYTGNTQLADMQGAYTCIFLRKTFTVSNPSAMAALRLTGICDDGFIAWVNGREIGRFNMPAGPVAFNATSLAALGEPIAGYVITTNNPADFLVAGNNVICIQAFNASLAGSSDFTIDAALSSIDPDGIPPVIFQVTPANGTIVSNLTSVTVSFTEPVQGVNASDLLINGVAATNVTGASDTYTFTFRQPAYGTVQFSWAVGHGITDFGFPTPNPFDATGAGATWQITLTDSTPPVVSIYRPLQFVTVIKLTNITVIFNEPVSGVDASDLLINGAPAASVTSLSSTQYVFQFSQPPSGTVNVQWAGGHGIQDQAGIPNNFAGGSWTYNLDPNAVIGGVRINEFMAANANGIVDEDNSHQDWVELLNFSSNVVSLAGWSLTDDASVPDRWVFPEVSIQPGKFMLIWCSGKDRKPLSGTNMHTNFKISNGGGHLALLNSEDPRQVLSAYDYPIQRADISYGLEPAAVGYGTNTNFRYFQPSTPRAANLASAITAIVGDIHFDVKRGFYNAPIAVTITCDSTNATIRYTTNGSAPTVTATVTNGAVFTTALVITNTSTIRAAAFIPGALASDSETHTYLFTADIIREPDETAPTPQWPAERKATAQIYDYGMDPNIVNLPAVAATIQDDLKFIPSYCISMDLNDLFAPATGIYANPGGDTIAWERPGSIELIYPEGDGGFQINGGVRIRGGFSRDGNNPKHAFRFFFRQEYGKGKLDYPAFSNPSYGPKPPTSFNKYDLRTMQNYSWAYQNDTRMMCLRDVFSRDAQLALGSASSHGDFYHLYINGVYWGLYNTDERPEANFGADYYGGNADDYDTIKVAPDDGYIIYATDGDLGAWTRLWNQAVGPGGLNSDAAYEKVQGNNPDGTPNPAYENLLDVDNMIDYMLVIYYGGNLDAPISNFLSNTSPNNFFGFRDRTGTHGGFRFVAHDSEHTLLDVNADRTGPYTAGDTLLKSNPQYFYQQMWGNAELRMRSADHIQKACFNGGPLSPEGAAAILMARSNVLWHAISAESARWGDAKREPPFRREDWVNAFTTVMNTFVPGRTTVLLNQLRGKGLYPTNFAPVFSKFGGLVPAGYSLSISNPNPSGIIYYTLDGTDPRARGGAVSPTAIAYSGPITLNSKTTVRTRIKDGGTWSAIVEATFFVDQDFSKFIVSELMYNPPKFGTNDGDNYEFLELKNTGTNTLDLGGLTFTSGITFTFTNGTQLAPGAFFVLAHTTNGLTGSGLIYAKYPGLVVNGFYTGRFDNNGEKITISHPLGTTVLSFTYSDTSPWPVAPDGNGFSLVPRDPNSNPNPDSSTSWRASANIGGSPGADDPPSNIPSIVVNEVLTHSLLSVLDRVELFNPTPNVVDVGGWFLSDDNGSPKKFRIPNNTPIQPNGYLVFNEDDFNPCANRGNPASCTNGFQFDASGEQVYLFSGDANTNLTGYSHGFSFAAADPDVSFGRYVNSVGEEQFPAQSTSTFGGANSGPRVGPVVINEVNYHPGLGFDEFVEIKNITGSDVPLYDVAFPTNRWKINGLGYTFPAATVIPANGLILLVNIQPPVFRTKYSVPAEVQVLGPFSGNLQDSGELLEITKPETPPATNGVHYIVIDAVRYNDKAPWPASADGDGPSLQRITSSVYGNDPNNWFASGITPGLPNVLNTPPIVTFLNPPDGSVFTVPFSTTLQANASDPDGSVGTVEFFQNGVKIGEATTPPYNLTVSNITAGNYEFYARAIDNGFSVSKSATNHITVQFPPPADGFGFLAEFWTLNGTANANFNLAPTLVRTNATIDIDWGTGSPDAAISVDNFSARWTAVIKPRFTDTYVFYGTSDDGERVYINNVRVLDSWIDQGPTEHASIGVPMVAGQNYLIKMEWYENGGGAAAHLAWGSTYLPKEIIPPSQVYPYGLPVIGSQPSGAVSVPVGSNYVLNATLLGQAPFSARWFYNGSPLATFDNINNGQTSITLPNAQSANEGAYYFILSNTFGMVTSLVANVSVGSPVSITIPPSNVTALEGDTVNFGVTVSGTPPFTYVWTRGTFPAGNFATNVSSFTSDAITLPNVAFTNANTYRVTVQNSFGPAATATATLAISYAPKITTQPTNQLAAIGGAVTFSVAATSVPAPSYFWYFNQTNLVLTGTNRLTLSNIQPNQAGPYNVVVSNSIGSVTSSVANLVLGFGPTITAQPQSISAAIGGTAVFSMSVTGTFPMGATLRKSGIGFLNQAINDSNIVFTIANVKASDASTAYSIKVTNDFNKTPGVTSASFALTILTPPAITTNPTNFATSFGSTGYFAVVATGVPTPTYQWYFNVTNLLVGATNASLTVTNAQAANSGLYHAVAINSQGTATSTVATLNLPLPPNIIIQPVSAVTALGTSVTFRVTATGLAPLKYFWQFNGSNITAAVSTAYTLSNPQLSNEGPYRVVITNTLGAVTSSIVTLVIDSDLDGMPDAFELAYGLNPRLAGDASGDLDGDGVSNYQEYLAGTNPTNAASFLKLTSDGLAPDGSIILRFTAVSNRSYSILSKPTIDAGSWLSISNILGVPADRTVIITNTVPGGGQRYYRLVTPQTP